MLDQMIRQKPIIPVFSLAKSLLLLNWSPIAKFRSIFKFDRKADVLYDGVGKRQISLSSISPFLDLSRKLT